MRILLFCCLITQLSYAQPGFNKGYEFGYYFNYFFDVVVQHDTIIAYGIAQDTTWPYLQGVLVARFDTLGNWLDKTLILDTTNNIYSIDKSWGKIIPTADGGCAMTAAALYGRDGVFIKLNRKLELEFAQRYKDTINLGEFLVSPIEVPEGYLLYGFYQHGGNAKHDAMIRKVDKQGHLIWRKNFGVYDQYEAFYKAIPLGDSLLLLCGRKVFNIILPGTSLPWISAFNYKGELQWEWSTNTLAPYNGIYLAWFYPQTDNSWLVLGSKYLGLNPEYGWEIYQQYWVKLDKNFQFQWAKPFGPSLGNFDYFSKEIQAQNGDIIGIGQRGPFEFDPQTYYRKGWVMRFSSQADSIWEWTGKMPVTNPGAHFFSGGALLSSGSIVAAGTGEDSNGHGLCWLVKLSPDGCVDTLMCHPTSTLRSPQTEQIGIQIYPNPAQDYVEIRVSGPKMPTGTSIRLSDLQGRLIKVWHPGELSQPLPLAGIPAGIYFVQFVSAQGGIFAAKKLVVGRL